MYRQRKNALNVGVVPGKRADSNLMFFSVILFLISLINFCGAHFISFTIWLDSAQFKETVCLYIYSLNYGHVK